MEQNIVLEMRDISKNFTGVRALSHVDFTLRKGEIHQKNLATKLHLMSRTHRVIPIPVLLLSTALFQKERT